jgi:acetylxylan esterase
MVKYAIRQYNADPDRVFTTGSSSGCMMSTVLSFTYPDLFRAATCYSGVPAGCLTGGPGSSPISSDPKCKLGQVVKTSKQWLKEAQDMYPGYNGTYPRMATWHGHSDTFVSYLNLAEEIKQWSAIHGVEFTKNNTDVPQPGYTQMVYGDGTKFVAYSALGVGHTVPVHATEDLAWFGL